MAPIFKYNNSYHDFPTYPLLKITENPLISQFRVQ